MASRPSATRTGSRRMRSRRCSDSVAWSRKPPTNTRKRSTAGRSSSRSPDVNGAIPTMKVVLFCGGLGTRLREYSETVPKPMVNIGQRPIIWHLMKYYAHYGHTEFILCLGYRGDLIKEYFLNYDECVSNDFTLSDGGKTVHVHHRDIDDWKITFAETGLHSNLGQRLLAAEKYVGTDDVFLANYSDGLTDLSLPAYLEHFR